MDIVERINFILGEEMTSGSVGTSTGGQGYTATTTGDIAKFPEKFVVGYNRKKKKKKKKQPSLQ